MGYGICMKTIVLILKWRVEWVPVDADGLACLSSSPCRGRLGVGLERPALLEKELNCSISSWYGSTYSGFEGNPA